MLDFSASSLTFVLLLLLQRVAETLNIDAREQVVGV